MAIDKETQEKIQELQSLEHTLHNLIMQKQAFQVELTEVETAFSETTKTSDDVYKLVGNILIKANKEELSKELKRKQEILSLRLKSIEKQEDDLEKRTEALRDDVMKRIK